MNNKKIKIKPYEATQEFLYQPYQIATNNMKTKEEELREGFNEKFGDTIKLGATTQLDINIIADWWLEKLRQAVAEERERTINILNKWTPKEKYLSAGGGLVKGLTLDDHKRNFAEEIIRHLTQE